MVKLTTTQALVRFMINQKVRVDDKVVPLFASVWAIFGHGNVAGLGEVLYPVRDLLPTFRGHNEQSMAHATFAKADPVALARTCGPRITHVHCKDLRLSVRDAALARDASFFYAVFDWVFTVPGDGDVDFPTVLSEMCQVDYASWLVVEAERDPDKANPKTYAEMGYASLNRMAAGPGLH